jgi:NAD(P)-dependent dehydrogenase (short-subunit alcohol dehydrogenase family)
MHNPIREIASDTSQSAAGGIERARTTPDGPGRCVDQTTAVGRELFSDFFERYPDLRMVHSMLDGGFFSIAQMLLPKASKRADKVQRFATNGDELARQLRETYAQIRERFQQDVTVAFTNMGMMPDSPQYPRRDVADITGVEWDSYMGTALKGAFNSTAIALREMRATGAGPAW